jgi:hypothetical protein
MTREQFNNLIKAQNEAQAEAKTKSSIIKGISNTHLVIGSLVLVGGIYLLKK